jgi:CxxC-x17-CxxC domain-containing protein
MGNFQGGGSRDGNFKRENRGGGFRSGNRGGRSDVTMHKAICDECHKSCEVPFRPSGDKPVYCSDCFSGKRDVPKRDFNDRGPKRDYNDKSAQSFLKSVSMPQSGDVSKQLSEISSKLDRLTSMIEKLIQPKIESKPITKSVIVKKVKVKKVPAIKVATKKSVALKVPVKKATNKKKK